MSHESRIERIGRRAAPFALTLALAALAGGCEVREEGVLAPDGYYYDDVYPPEAYVAAADPLYDDGHPVVWWGGFWYYREGGHWHHYVREPVFLRERRPAPVRRIYVPAYRHEGFRGPGHRRR